MRYLGNHPLFTGHPIEPHLDWINALFWHLKLDKKKISDGLFKFILHLVTGKKVGGKSREKNWNKKVLNCLSVGTRNYSEYSLVMMSSFSFSQQNIIVYLFLSLIRKMPGINGQASFIIWIKMTVQILDIETKTIRI